MALGRYFRDASCIPGIPRWRAKRDLGYIRARVVSISLPEARAYLESEDLGAEGLARPLRAEVAGGVLLEEARSSVDMWLFGKTPLSVCQ